MASRTERLHGTLTSWDDDRGFGFITPAQGSGKAFVHIKAFQPGPARPQRGEQVTFEVEQSPEGKLRATRVRLNGQRTSPLTRRPSSRGRPSAAWYLPIFGFAIGYIVVNALWGIPLWVAGFYLAVSIVCFLVYAADKSAASAGRWRVSETTLLLWGVACGWPGAIVAQQTLRHKTQKTSFQSAFWGSVVVNLIVFAVFATPAFALFVEWTKRPLF
jgi:uncharacterized membrane protein YsdA (DUF1294 family)/cold shock CspA family protein